MATWLLSRPKALAAGMAKLRGTVLSLCLALNLIVCGITVGHARDYLPGGVEYYSVGSSLDKDYFTKHVERVQYDYALYPKHRWWIDSGPPANPSAINMLQSYMPLNVRWKLKDGRQFVAENIDVRAVMREYFKHNDLKVQWEREDRSWAIGDSYPSLVYDVREDQVILKWLIRINKTPYDQRILPSGAATRWAFEYEEHIAGAVKGTATQGIDFENRQEVKRKPD
jgi:hypothetical protein